MRTSVPCLRDPSTGIGRCTTHACDQIDNTKAITPRRARIERDMLTSVTGGVKWKAAVSAASQPGQA
jgi:hypothetical protein